MKRKKTKDGFKQVGWRHLYDLYKVENPDVDSDTYQKVIGSFFDVYFAELYFQMKPKYFFLSGMIRKCRGRKFYSYKTEKMQRHYGINFLWYLRPGMTFFTNVKMLKRTSTEAILQKIEQRWRLRNDVELLQPLSDCMNSVKLYKDD